MFGATPFCLEPLFFRVQCWVTMAAECPVPFSTACLTGQRGHTWTARTHVSCSAFVQSITTSIKPHIYPSWHKTSSGLLALQGHVSLPLLLFPHTILKMNGKHVHMRLKGLWGFFQISRVSRFGTRARKETFSNAEVYVLFFCLNVCAHVLLRLWAVYTVVLRDFSNVSVNAGGCSGSFICKLLVWKIPAVQMQCRSFHP